MSVKNKIYYFTIPSKKQGGAAINRQTHWVNGFKELGFESEICSIYEHSISVSGNIGWALNLIISYFTVLKYLIKFIKEKKEILAIIVYGTIRPFFILAILKKTGILIIAERTEYPLFVRGKTNKIIEFAEKCYDKPLKHADGFVTCTDVLIKYYSQYTSNKCKFIKVPFLVDFEKFNKAPTTENHEKYITYCGDMRSNKDGVGILIEAFSIVAQQLPNIKLMLIGDADKYTTSRLDSIVAENNIHSKVFFTGRIKHSDMPIYLKKASVLALARPSNKQAEGGFPSKLGEYLATGNPVVVTRTGEISNYLTDMENAYLVEPDSVEKFADKLLLLLNNEEQAKEIGAKGAEIANRFEYKKTASELVKFINELKIS